MAYNCKISNVSWFILFHKRKNAMMTRLNPVCGVALTASKSMDQPAIRKRIRSTNRFSSSLSDKSDRSDLSQTLCCCART